MQNGLLMYRRRCVDESILITELNDFIFCPVSIYFHRLYGNMDTMLYQTEAQINGSSAHTSIDKGNYSTKSTVLSGIDVYCEKYGLIGKIDSYDSDKKLLRERKRMIKNVYDGYVFQIYAQYFAMTEMGYQVERLELYSMLDNKVYPITLPEKDKEMLQKFECTIYKIRNFSVDDFVQDNCHKCEHCIYEPACDRAI